MNSHHHLSYDKAQINLHLEDKTKFCIHTILNLELSLKNFR